MLPEEHGYDPLSEERPGILARLVRMNRCFLVLLVIPATALAWWPPYAERDAKQQVVRQLQEKRDALRVEVSRKKEKLELIKTDSEYLEVVARDLLESRKDGETIVLFKNE